MKSNRSSIGYVGIGLLAMGVAVAGGVLAWGSPNSKHTGHSVSIHAGSQHTASTAEVVPRLLPDGKVAPQTPASSTGSVTFKSNAMPGVENIPPAGGPVYAYGGVSTSPDILNAWLGSGRSISGPAISTSTGKTSSAQG
jgi:hypothetical protein